jgi:hypothetical protein
MTTTTAPRTARVYPAPGLHWVGDGFRVMGYTSAYPALALELSPFLLIDYHPPYDYAPTTARRGVGVHPHRGFQTVTLAFDGSVAHHDSAGHGGVIGPGDVQWMSAASGILHQEYHEERYARRGGPFHMAQIWVNLPAALKMSPPTYQAIQAAEIPEVALPAGKVRVVAGSFGAATGPARTATPLGMFEVALEAGGEVTFEVPAEHTAAVLVMAGGLALGARVNDLVVFDHAGDHVTLTAGPASRLLVLTGEPIREPIVQHGPFVMNTVAEIEQAIDDFNAGKFGSL